MIVLLPPSEAKLAPPTRGRTVNLGELSFPELTPLREAVLAALEQVSARPDAAARLGVGPSMAAQVQRNTRLRRLPTVSVPQVYTGVLYEALDWASLATAARRRARSRLVVVSALWGAVRPGDRVPPYRLSMDVDLPGIGPLAPAWREVLGAALGPLATDERAGLIIDCRSAAYTAPWRPPRTIAGRTVAVHAVRTDPSGGGRTGAGHDAKHARGLVTRALLQARADPRDPTQLAELLTAAHLDVELAGPAAGRPWRLDVVLPSSSR